MTAACGERTYQFKALTDIWTGDAEGEPDRLITTDLLGSIRWWFEVLVRGLGGNACDPSNTKCEGRHHCVVCELFGCTGWARKFRFDVLDENGNIKKDQNKAIFKFRFTPLRPIRDEEWALLDATLRLIADFGAIGGKTVFKPTDEKNRENNLHHQDFGLIKPDCPIEITTKETDLKEYVSQKQWKKVNHDEFAWASLQHFWCVNGKYLRRVDNYTSTFNQVLGRQEAKKQGQQLATRNDEISKWLAGSQQESKKVFSFKDPARTFGFVKPELINFKTMEERLKNVWRQNDWVFLTRDKIIDQLFDGKGNRS